MNLNRFVPAEEELTGTAPASPSHSSEHFDFERNGLLNAPDPIARLLRLTRELFTASRKVQAPGHLPPRLRVPMREVALANGETLILCDTSGPYTDPRTPIDARRGLPDLHSAWREAGGSELCVPIRKEGVMP